MLVLLSLVSSLVLARQGGHHGHRRPVTGGYSTQQSGAGGLGSLLEGVQVSLRRETILGKGLLLIYLRIIVTTLRHIDIMMLVHKICNNGRQRSLKPTRLQPADCVSAEPAGRQADRTGLRAGGPGQAALPPGHPAGHLGGSQEVSRGM